MQKEKEEKKKREVGRMQKEKEEKKERGKKEQREKNMLHTRNK